MNNYRLALTLLLAIFLGGYSIAQSNNCTGTPAALAVNATCTNSAFSNNQNGTGQTLNASCAGGYGTAYQDVWYTVTGTGNPMTITISGANQDAVLAAFTGCGTGELVCNTIDAGTSGSIVFATTFGTTFYIQIQRRSGMNGSNMSGDICAISAAGALSNDGPCSATPLTVNASCSYTSSSNAGATDSGIADPGCAFYSGGDAWFSVVVPASGNITVTTNDNGGIGDGGLALYSGACGSPTFIACDDDSGVGSFSSITLTGQTPGTTLLVRAWEFAGGAGGTFDICAFEPVIVAPPANDDCAGAFPVTVNATAGCASVTSGTVNGATASTQDATSCFGTEDDDVWFSFVAPATGALSVDILNIVGSTTDMYHSVWEGTCPALTLVANTCSDPNNQTLTGLTPGTTYFIRVYTWTGIIGQTSSFDVCLTEYTPPPAPSNDNCSGATALTVNPASCTTTTAGTVVGATSSAQGSGACFGTPNDDVWYTFVAPATGSVDISLLNIAGSTTDMYHSVWEGTCPALTQVAGSCSDPNTSSVTGLTPGNTYYVQVYTYSSTVGASSTFDMCIVDGSFCGGGTTNDYCQAPAILTQGPGSWSSSTYNYYTADPPANYGGSFCGSVENNSWYMFTALSTTETFNFTSVTNCSSNWGVQAEVYEVTTDVNGCCTAMTSVSNCWNAGTATTGIVTATPLTIGNTYILMVDGWGGDNCEFTVSDWTATGILPVELVHFNAIASTNHNIISWQTETEYNNDYFRVMRSFDAENFEEIATVKGKGNSSIATNYQFNDMDVRNGDTYYRLEQVDFDGTTTVSETISLNRKPLREGFLNMYPNPAENAVTLELYDESIADVTIEITSMSGQMVFNETISINGLIKKNINISTLSNGVYNVVVRQADDFEMTRLIVE